MATEALVEIPEEVREAYRAYRPAPPHRATGLERALDTPARIHCKKDSVSPDGSRKVNMTLAQASYNRAEGVTRLATETGAEQWEASSPSPRAPSGSTSRSTWSG